jgi:hypothetical protein
VIWGSGFLRLQGPDVCGRIRKKVAEATEASYITVKTISTAAIFYQKSPKKVYVFIKKKRQK